MNLKEQGRLLRQGEFVVWEGSRARKTVRHVFLFEDMILFSKSRRDPEKKVFISNVLIYLSVYYLMPQKNSGGIILAGSYIELSIAT